MELTTSEKIRLIVKMQGRTLSEVASKNGITHGAFSIKLDTNYWIEPEIEELANVLNINYYFGFDYDNFKQNNNLTVTQQIKQILKDKGIRQVELAEKLGVTKSTLSTNLKRDKWSEPYLKRIGEALNVKPCVVFILQDGTEI